MNFILVSKHIKLHMAEAITETFINVTPTVFVYLIFFKIVLFSCKP